MRATPRLDALALEVPLALVEGGAQADGGQPVPGAGAAEVLLAAAPQLEGPREPQGRIARARPVLVGGPAFQIEGAAVPFHGPFPRLLAATACGEQVAQLPAALAASMVGAEGEVQVGALVAGGAHAVERPALKQPLPVLALAQIVPVYDAEARVGRHIASPRRVQKQDLGRPVAVDAAAPVRGRRVRERLAEVDVGQLQRAPASPIGARRVRRHEHAPRSVWRRLAHPQPRQPLALLASAPVDGEHPGILAAPAPAGPAQYLRHEARLGSPVAAPSARRSEHQVRRSLEDAHLGG